MLSFPVAHSTEEERIGDKNGTKIEGKLNFLTLVGSHYSLNLQEWRFNKSKIYFF